MKKSLFFLTFFALIIGNLIILFNVFSNLTKTANNSIEANEIVQTIQNNWQNFESYQNNSKLNYVVLDLEGNVLYKTKNGLSESLNEAINHWDVIMDIMENDNLVGKLIIYNNQEQLLQTQRTKIIVIVLGGWLLALILLTIYLFWIEKIIIQPFQKLKYFAERVAEGNLDIPLQMDKHNIFGAFTESFDIMRSELKKARLAEAKANASKKELVAKLSHDIKTPVASIKAVSEVGYTLAENNKQQEAYQSIITKTDQINALITNLFTATLEELHQLTVDPQDLDSSNLKVLIENSDYKHFVKMSPIPQCLLYVDKLRLQQVFDNIIINSYKYANTTIDVLLEKRDNYLFICFEDYGGGVDALELQLIKEKFKRGTNSKNIEGSGLGLYISNYFMEAMKGQLIVENGQAGLKVSLIIALSGTI